jgi:hypothetical protein
MDGSMDRVQQRDPEQVDRLHKRLKERQLPLRAEHVEGLLGELDGALDDLQMILGPVLRPAGPSPALEGVRPDPETELAALLQNLSGRLHRAVLFARDLADRVDL